MNWNLPQKKKKQQQEPPQNSQLGLGLNTRGRPGEIDSSLTAKRTKNVLGDSSSNDEEEDSDVEKQQTTTATAAVNQALVKEQAALRQRAMIAAAATVEDGASIYDYDGAYDSFSTSNNQNKKQKQSDDQNKEKKSRYIGNLKQVADQRQRERELVLERKIAKEQQQQDEENPELRGKDKFVTAAYKRKLQERQLWQHEQEQKHEQEAQRAKESGAGLGVMAKSFYGNLSTTSATSAPEEQQGAGAVEWTRKEEPDAQGFMTEGFERASPTTTFGAETANDTQKPSATAEKGKPDQKPNTVNGQEQQAQQLTPRQIREQKVAQARLRYFQRHPNHNTAAQ